MREIKFRALLKDAITGKMWWEYYSTFSNPAWSSISEWIIIVKDLQFTGLHDKNGKEIYEGDILKEQMPPEMESDISTWVVEWYVDDIHCGWNTDPAMTWFSEVIGNVHENAELLK